jgi:hypothetical protein
MMDTHKAIQHEMLIRGLSVCDMARAASIRETHASLMLDGMKPIPKHVRHAFCQRLTQTRPDIQLINSIKTIDTRAIQRMFKGMAA